MEERYYKKKILQDCIMSEGLFEIRDKKYHKWFVLVEGIESADKVVEILNGMNRLLIEKDQQVRKQVVDEIRGLIQSPFQELADDVGVTISIPKARILKILDKVEGGEKQ